MSLEHFEYLADKKTQPSGAITQVYIVELLACIPWATDRAQQHVVNETSHALYKVIVFTNSAANPLQKWQQGRWFASWSKEAEGDHTCTLFVSIQVGSTNSNQGRAKTSSGYIYQR
jgi:hypothetical protein